MLNTILDKIRGYRRKRHFSSLISKGLKIGNNSYINDGGFIDPSHCFLISIGNNCNFAPNVRLIAHDASLKQYIGISKIGRIRIYDNCFLGDSVIVLPGVSIGPKAIIGAGSVVTKDIPENSVAAGNPAKVIMTLDKYLEKHQERSMKQIIFSEEQYNINVISKENKQLLINYLENNMSYIGKLEKI